MFLFYIRIYRSLYIYIYIRAQYIYTKIRFRFEWTCIFFFFYSIWEKNYIYKHDDTIINTYKYKYYYYILIGTQDASQNFVPFVGSDIYIYICIIHQVQYTVTQHTPLFTQTLCVFLCILCPCVLHRESVLSVLLHLL